MVGGMKRGLPTSAPSLQHEEREEAKSKQEADVAIPSIVTPADPASLSSVVGAIIYIPSVWLWAGAW